MEEKSYLEYQDEQRYQTKDYSDLLLEDVRSNNVFSDWLHPSQVEARKLREQLFLDQNQPVAKMRGLKAAGINPLFAAGDVAKSGSVLPGHEGSSNPIGDVASVAGAIGTGLSGLAAMGMTEVAKEKLPSEIEEIQSRAAEEFSKAGLNNATTQGVLTDNKYKDQDWKASLNIKRQQFDNMKAEYQNILANHEFILQQIEESRTQAELNGSLKDVADSTAALNQENLRWQKELNDFRINNKLFITESGIDGYFYSQILAGADLSSIDTFIDIYSRYRSSVAGAVSRAEYESELETAYARSNAYGRGQYDSDPLQRQFQDAFNTIDELNFQKNEFSKALKALDAAYNDGAISKEEYIEKKKVWQGYIDDIDKGINSLNRHIGRVKSQFGHRSAAQDMLVGSFSGSLGSYFRSAGVSNPVPVRGYRSY